MGEYADYMLNGDDCECCGMPFDDPGPGYPRRCEDCEPTIQQTALRPASALYANKAARNRAKKARRKARAQAVAP